MARVTSKIVNKTDYLLTLSEGNAGVYSKVAEIKLGESFTCSIDANATYREYWIRASGTTSTLILTSDDLVEFAVITIISEGENLSREDTEHRRPSRPSESPLSRFLEWFRWRN